jgi:hypothetical protein
MAYIYLQSDTESLNREDVVIAVAVDLEVGNAGGRPVRMRLRLVDAEPEIGTERGMGTHAVLDGQWTVSLSTVPLSRCRNLMQGAGR